MTMLCAFYQNTTRISHKIKPACLSFSRLKSKKHEVKYKFGNIRRSSEPQEIARDYFDENYSAYFDSQWPSIRCAMLSRKKYCCVLNNFINVEKYEKELIQSGAYNFVSKMNCQAEEKYKLLHSESKRLSNKIISLQSAEANTDIDNKTIVALDEDLPQMIKKLDEISTEMEIYEELSTNCSSLRAYVFPRANITEFKVETLPVNMMSIHQNYLLDAASVLPVLALAPEEGDVILDMCAAPGGKFISMLQQVGEQAQLVANDPVKSRRGQILGVMNQFLPMDCEARNNTKIVGVNGIYWSEIETECYNKVLVDVPCTNDRLSMYTPDVPRDNIFCYLRKNERAKLPELQANLLKNAVLACHVGGTIVYSTCTASQWQNEFVVQYVVQDLLDNHNVECEVEDLKHLKSLLQDEFNFYANSTLGILVQPHMEANFGPMFICKLTRYT